jgi:hypothetical protein
MGLAADFALIGHLTLTPSPIHDAAAAAGELKRKPAALLIPAGLRYSLRS